MIKGKLVVIDNLNLFKTMQQSSDPIPDSAVVFIKNEGQIWTKGSYFGVQKTYTTVSKTDAGLAPKGGDSASSLISNVDTEWVLTVTSGASPSWRKLPANAFKNTTYTFYNLAFKNSAGTTVDTYKPTTSPTKTVKAGSNVTISASDNVITIAATDTTYSVMGGASADANGTSGLVPQPTKGNQAKFLRADGSWATPTNTTYSVVTAAKNGLVPMFDAADGTIDAQDSDWVLTNNNGSIGWYKLPANAFNNSTYSVMSGATPNDDGTQGLVPKPTKSNVDMFLKGDGTWATPTNTTYSVVTKTANGLVPKTGTTASATISSEANEWVLTTTSGNTPTWRKLPSAAFTTASYTLPTAKTTALGGIKVGSVNTDAFANLSGKFYSVSVDKNGLAYVQVPWTDTTYTLPTATSSKLGGVKVGTTLTDVTGYTKVHIKDGFLYYKDTNSTNYLPLSGGTLTGPLDIFGELYNGNYGINMNNSDIINVNSITLADTCNAAGEGIKFVRTDNKYDSIWAIDGTLYFSTNGTLSTQTTTGSFANNYNVYHSGNCTLLDATRLCSIYGTSTPNNMDNRPTSANITFLDKSIRYFLATSSMTEGKPTVGDSCIIHCSWDNNGWNSQLAFPTNSTLSMQWRTLGDGSGEPSVASIWSNWKTILDSSNYTSYCAAAGHTHSYLPLSGGDMTGSINYKGTKATHPIIKFIDNTTDTSGNGISIGGKGLVIIGSGESPDAILLDTALALHGGTEITYITSDNDIVFYSNCQTGSSAKKTMTFDINGYLKAPKFQLNLNDSSGNWGAEFIDGTGAIGSDGTNNYVLPQRGTSYIRSGNTDLYHRKNGTDYVILDSSNRASYCLPISGGTLTGPLSLPANMYGTEGALNLNNSNILNVNAIFTSDNAEDAGEGIQFARNNGNYDSIWCSGGVFYFSPNGGTASQAYNNNYTVIHSGNYTSYLSGGSWNGGTVTNEITISRNASGDTMLKCLRTDTGYSTRFGMGSGGVNRGIWDDKFNKWVFYCDASNTYITNNTWIHQDAWNNGLCLNRTVSGGGCAIKVHSNGTYLGEFGIAGNSTFEVDIAGSTVMTCNSGGNLNVSGSISIAGNKLTFVT